MSVISLNSTINIPPSFPPVAEGPFCTVYSAISREFSNVLCNSLVNSVVKLAHNLLPKSTSADNDKGRLPRCCKSQRFVISKPDMTRYHIKIIRPDDPVLEMCPSSICEIMVNPDHQVVEPKTEQLLYDLLNQKCPLESIGTDLVIYMLNIISDSQLKSVQCADQNKNNMPIDLLRAVVASGHTEVLRYLIINRRFPLGTQFSDGSTHLMVAAYNGHEQVVQLLLDHGADPNILGKNDSTALMLAAENGHTQVVRKFCESLKKKGDLAKAINQKTTNDFSALYLAAHKGHEQVVQVLLDHGADPNILGINGSTALMVAAENGHTQVVRKFCESLKKKGDLAKAIDQKTTNGFSALYLAAQNGHEQVVRELLKHGADPNILNGEGGFTVLILAAQQGNIAVLHALLDNKAEVNQKLNNAPMGHTALDFAVLHGQKKAEDLLRKNGAKRRCDP